MGDSKFGTHRRTMKSMIVVVVALMAFDASLAQFSVFNRQLFPSFSFGRPASRPVQPPRPRFVPRPQPSRFVSQPSFNSAFRPAPVPAPVSAPAPAPEPAPAPASNKCNRLANVEHNGKWYWVQWKNRGAPKYSWSAAKASCSNQGMKMISMNDPSTRDFFLNMLERDRYDYFWAGAKISRGSLNWENGKSEGISRGQYPWSTRGAIGPQPEGNGNCLAILNNVYNDRVKYHDVA